MRPANDPAIVEINGKVLTLSEMERQSPAALFAARTTYYENERKAVDAFIDQYLLDTQAGKENLTLPQLLEKHVDSTIAKEPSEEALRVYYEGVDTTESFESLRTKIIETIRDRRIAKAKAAYVQSLRSQAKIVLRIPPPRAPFSTKDTYSRGSSNAPVTLLEFADYECPACQQFQPAVEKLEADFKGTLLFVHRDMPLQMHPNAQKAAEASRCAAAQNKYWKYYDQLTSTKELDVPALKKHARSLGLNAGAFDKCLDNGETAAAVKADVTEGESFGVTGTPTFFVNGRYVSGNPSYERLRAIIAEELSAAENAVASSSRQDASQKARR